LKKEDVLDAVLNNANTVFNNFVKNVFSDIEYLSLKMGSKKSLREGYHQCEAEVESACEKVVNEIFGNEDVIK
jgi:hypothetical protein